MPKNLLHQLSFLTLTRTLESKPFQSLIASLIVSTDTVLPTLAQWTTNHLTAIKKEQDLNNALDTFLSKGRTRPSLITVLSVKVFHAELEKQFFFYNAIYPFHSWTVWRESVPI